MTPLQVSRFLCEPYFHPNSAPPMTQKRTPWHNSRHWESCEVFTFSIFSTPAMPQKVASWLHRKYRKNCPELTFSNRFSTCNAAKSNLVALLEQSEKLSRAYIFQHFDRFHDTTSGIGKTVQSLHLHILSPHALPQKVASWHYWVHQKSCPERTFSNIFTTCNAAERSLVTLMVSEKLPRAFIFQ